MTPAEGVPVRWIACPNGDHYDERAVTTEVEAEAKSHADTMNSDAPDDEEWGVLPLYTHPAAASAESIRAEVIEECAKVADEVATNFVGADPSDDYRIGQRVGAEYARNAIRALSARATKEG